MPKPSISSVHETGAGFIRNYVATVNTLWISDGSWWMDYMRDKLKTPEKVDKQKFEQVLARLIATPPIRSKELVGKSKKPRSQK
jgi:hypothetical protein